MIKGSTEPRIFTPPLRELTRDTTLGYDVIDYAHKILKQDLYPWQEWFFIHALEIIGDLQTGWHFRFRTVLLLVSRQNGKTVTSKVLASFFLNVLGVDSVFGTSLSLDKAVEVWEDVLADQERIPELRAEIKRVGRTNGNMRIMLNGNRVYKVGAPTRRAGRGDSNDLVMLDELREHRDWEAWSASAASINAKPNGIVMCFSNAGDPDSVVLRQIRSSAISVITGQTAGNFGGQVEDVSAIGLFEWSSTEGAKTDDLQELAKANPALGYGLLTERALLANQKSFPESKFRSECMCQQVETILPNPFPDGAWEAGLDLDSCIAGSSELYFGIDMSSDRRWTSIGVCGLREDGNWHIEVAARRVGTEWAIDWFRERALRSKIKLAFQSRGAPVSGLAEQICTIKGVERYAIEGGDLTAGWGRFWDGIAAGQPTAPGEGPRGGTRIFHVQQPVLEMPAKTMQLRNLGGGVELPDRVKSPDDISPLYACIMAFSAASMPRRESKVYESSYAKGNSLVFI